MSARMAGGDSIPIVSSGGATINPVSDRCPPLTLVDPERLPRDRMELRRSIPRRTRQALELLVDLTPLTPTDEAVHLIQTALSVLRATEAVPTEYDCTAKRSRELDEYDRYFHIERTTADAPSLMLESLLSVYGLMLTTDAWTESECSGENWRGVREGFHRYLDFIAEAGLGEHREQW